MQRSEQMAGKAKRTERAMERLDVVEKPWEGWELRLDFAEAGRPGAERGAALGSTPLIAPQRCSSPRSRSPTNCGKLTRAGPEKK